MGVVSKDVSNSKVYKLGDKVVSLKHFIPSDYMNGEFDSEEFVIDKIHYISAYGSDKTPDFYRYLIKHMNSEICFWKFEDEIQLAKYYYREKKLNKLLIYTK